MLSGYDQRGADLERFASLGISALRYPLLWETFARHAEPERLWAWHDTRLRRLSELGIRPILGLIHHGSGPPGTDLLSPSFAPGLAAHAAEAALRFPWVRDWTPVNEPLTTARFSALYGHWYPHRRDEFDFWTALFNQIDATRAAMAAIRQINLSARLIQTEDLGHTDATPERAGQAAFDNERRWASWDLLTGRLAAGHALWDRLVDMGFEERLDTNLGDPCPPDVLGLNHYLTSDRYLDHRLDLHPPDSHGDSQFGPLADVAAVRVYSGAPGLAGALRDCWQRYGIPIALTEVHNGCTREEQLRWLVEAWETAQSMGGDGVEIEAVTVWSLLGAFDWDSLLTRRQDHYESGVFDVRGPAPRETALAPLIRQLAREVSPVHPVLHNSGWWRGHAPLIAGTARLLLIVGATGTLGQAFAGGCRLRGINHVLTGRDRLDLRNPDSMSAALDELRPWAVINCGGWVRVDEAEHQPDECLAVNFTGSVALGEACSLRGIHYTSFSSDLVFDGLAGRAYAESDNAAPQSIYGMSKARSDAVLLMARGRSLIVRTASFFSPYDDHNFAVHAVAALRSGSIFRAASDCVTSPTYVPDLVRATLDLIIDDEFGLWHLVSDGASSWSDFALAICGALDLPIELVEAVPMSAMRWDARRPPHAPLTTERGHVMPSLSSAIERFAALV